ncbi:MAG: hypothetical protein AMXMBFR82_26820 [Candidatus Hydrogenedentota bacterium]
MRMYDDDSNQQIFDACLLLREEGFQTLLGFFEVCAAGEFPYDDHWHMMDFTDGPPVVWRTHTMREVTGLLYEADGTSHDPRDSRLLQLFHDAEGQIENVGPEENLPREGQCL